MFALPSPSGAAGLAMDIERSEYLRTAYWPVQTSRDGTTNCENGHSHSSATGTGTATAWRTATESPSAEWTWRGSSALCNILEGTCQWGERLLNCTADSVNLVQWFGTVCCLYIMKIVLPMQHLRYFFKLFFFWKYRGDIVHGKMYDVLRSFGSNNSMVLQQKKLRI